MLNWLLRRFVKNYEDTQDASVREAYGVLAGAMGVALNLLLFALKLPIGLMMRSIAITSDAFNNLSDMGSSLISVFSAKVSGRAPDKQHPFGHGRTEYLAALLVALIILMVGFELLKQSVGKLITPEEVIVNWPMLIVLTLSLSVKLFMYSYNRKFGEQIGSQVLRATASDSLNDVWTTGSVILATLLGAFVPLPVDAIAGLGVSALILLSGFGICRDTINLLMGGKPDPELVGALRRVVLEGEGVLSAHDLVIHDYGPGRVMASVHAEVRADSDLMRAHAVIDGIERRARDELNVELVVHMDPVDMTSARVATLREAVQDAVAHADARLSVHDVRVSESAEETSLRFELVAPYEMRTDERERAADSIRAELRLVDPRCRCIIQIDEGENL